MTNEQYLIVSYFCVAVFGAAIGFAAYLWLRAPLHGIAAALPWKAFRGLLSRLFPVGIVLPGLLGFISVNYRGCKLQEYEKIVADRSYLVSKSQQQISSSLTHVVWAVFAWCALIAVLLAVKRRFDRRAALSPDGS
jgi:hypothetical protein